MTTYPSSEARSSKIRVTQSAIDRHGGFKSFAKKWITGEVKSTDLVEITEDGKPIVSGEFLFELKATHGFPLEMALDRIMEVGAVVNWPEFIECARRNGWWDFQTYDCINHAMQDAEWPRDTQQEIQRRFQLYVMKNRHPKMIPKVASEGGPQ